MTIRALTITLAVFASAACASEASRRRTPQEPRMERMQEAHAPTTRLQPWPEVSAGEEMGRTGGEPASLLAEIIEAPSTPLENGAPELRILRPRPGKIVRGKVLLEVALSGWELEPTGKHLHLIVDDEPYIAVTDVSRPIDLGILVEEHLGRPLGEGTHVVRMFPSRMNHESVKEDLPFAWTTFHVMRRSDDVDFDPDAPMLTYSRPAGCTLQGEPLLVDFYLTNVPGLAPGGHRIRWVLDGETTGEITRWAPHHIENLGSGEHRLRLQLIGADGNVVPGLFNDTTRAFRIAETCPPQGAPIQSPDLPVPTRPAPGEEEVPPIPEAGPQPPETAEPPTT